MAETESKSLRRDQWVVLAAAFLGWMFDGMQLGLFPLVARPALQDVLGITDDAVIASWNSIIVACFLVGAAAGGLLFGWLGDKIGRVRAMTLSILAYSLFTGACYFAGSALQLGVYRFLAALGMGGQWSLGVALVMECWPQRHRPKLAGAIGAASNVGFLLIALVAMTRCVTTHDWRWLMLVGASPALLALAIIALVPESERWKAAAAKGGRSPVVEIFCPGLLRKTLLAMVFSAIPLIGTWAAVSGWVPIWVDQMAEIAAGRRVLQGAALAEFDEAAQPQQKHAVLVAALSEEQWRPIRDETSHARSLAQLVLSLGAIVGCFVAPLVGGALGRRPTYFGLCLLSLVTCHYLFRLVTYDAGFLVMVAITGAITAAFYGWLPLYLPELFPTRVRATGQGLCFNFGRLVAAGGSLCMGQWVGLMGGDYGRAMAAITSVYALGLVLIWLAPETKGRPLPE